jgi:mannosyltransferase OCH1-like enzyme
MIPRILHFVWVGDESKTPHKTIDRWRDLNPSFEVKVWGNADLSSGWQLADNMRYFASKELCGVADCIRWEVLYRQGGIALDADLEASRAIPDWMLEPEVWACWESELLRPGLVSNGSVGARPRNPLIGQIISDLTKDKPMGRRAWEFSGPVRLTMTWQEYQYRDLTIWPSQFFIPTHFAGLPYTGAGPVFGHQDWKSTRGKW